MCRKARRSEERRTTTIRDTIVRGGTRIRLTLIKEEGLQTMGPSSPMVSSSSLPTWIRQHVHNYCPVATHARVSIHSVHGLGSDPLSLHLTDGPLNAWLSHGSSEIPYCVVSPATVRGQVPRSELSYFSGSLCALPHLYSRPKYE